MVKKVDSSSKEKLCGLGGCVCSAVSCIPMFIVTFIAIASFAGFQLQLFVPSNFALNYALLFLLIISAVLIIYSVKAVAKARTFSIAGGLISVGTMIAMTGSGFVTHAAHLSSPLLIIGFWIGYALLIGSLYYSHRKMFLKMLLPSITIIAFVSLIIGVSLAPTSDNSVGKTSVSTSELILEKDNFVREANVNQYTKKENYFPIFRAGKAVLNVIPALTEGKIRIGVMDGVARWVLVEEITPKDTSPIQFITEEGAEGTWMVVLEFEKATGKMRIEMKPRVV